MNLSDLKANNKVYDGETSATISSYGSLDGIITGDAVTLNTAGASAAFEDKNVGTDKKVTVNHLALAGMDNLNYSITDQTTTANIKINEDVGNIDNKTNTTDAAATTQDNVQVTILIIQGVAPQPQPDLFTVPPDMSGTQSGTANVLQIDVHVVNTDAFTFTIPRELVLKAAGSESDVASAKATTLEGNSLPSWLTFDPKTQAFTAANAPAGSLPIQVTVHYTGVSGSGSVVMTIGEKK